MNIVNIWDMDGCWVLGYKLKKHNEAENAEVLKNQPLCKPFCDFARKSSLGCQNILVTGRKDLYLGNLTRKIVDDVLHDHCQIILFPDTETYNHYHQWKIEKINEIIDKYPDKIIKLYEDDEKIVRHFGDDERIVVYWVESDLEDFSFKDI